MQRVLLAMPSLSRPKQAQIARRLEAMGVEVQALPSFAQLIGDGAAARQAGAAVADEACSAARPSTAAPIWAATQIDRAQRLVTGGGGSIGSELCRQVLGCKPTKLVIFEISRTRALRGRAAACAPLRAEAGVELVAVLGSVTEARLVRRVLNEHAVDVVLHAAAYKHVHIVESNPLVGLANNVLGTWTMAREARGGRRSSASS